MTAAELVVIADADRERRATRAGRLAWIGAAAIVVLVLAVQPFSNTDVWWNLALGRLITATGIPAHEPFSFLPAAHAWIGQQWLYQVTLAGLVGAGGAGLASLVMGLVTTAAVVLAALSVPSTARVTGPWLALAMVISGVVLTSVAGVTSEEITVLGVAIVLFVLSRWRQGRTAAVWGLPPLVLIWANMDTGFAAGLLILLAALLLIRPAGSTGRRQLAIALAVSVIAAVANPIGPSIYASVIAGVFSPGAATNLIGWASPDFHDWSMRIFEAEIILMVVLWTISGGPDRFSAIVGFGLLVATLFAQENLGILAIVLTPQLAVHGARTWKLHVEPRLGNRKWVSPAPSPPHRHERRAGCDGRSDGRSCSCRSSAQLQRPHIRRPPIQRPPPTTSRRTSRVSASIPSTRGAGISHTGSPTAVLSSSTTSLPSSAPARSISIWPSISSRPTGRTCSPARISGSPSFPRTRVRHRRCTRSAGRSPATTRRAPAWSCPRRRPGHRGRSTGS